MIRWITFGSVLAFLMGAPPVNVLAQFNPYTNRPGPYGSGADLGVRRAQREHAVAYAGPVARDLIDTHGDEAVAAIFACSRSVAAKLASFHASGELGKLPRPRSLLLVIAQPRPGDDVALWAIAHVHELRDVDRFNAFLLHPLHYALGLKQLEAGAAEVRTRRLNQVAFQQPPVAAPHVPPAPPAAALQVPPAPPPLSAEEKLAVAVVAGLMVTVGFVLWRRR
jgi:hypothetical protein